MAVRVSIDKIVLVAEFLNVVVADVSYACAYGAVYVLNGLSLYRGDKRNLFAQRVSSYFFKQIFYVFFNHKKALI